MPDHALLRELVLIYALALVFIVVLARLKVPAVVALIAAGVAGGPVGLGIVKTQQDVELFAEVGIVLLLFTVGLDFSMTEIRRIWKAVVIGGTLQVAGTAAVVLLIVLAGRGLAWRQGLFIGLFVALSSTAIVLKELSERNQLDAPHGKLMVGILLFQDVCLIVLLLIVPMLSGQTSLMAAPGVLVKGLLTLAVLAAASRIVLPPLFRIVTLSGRREAFPLAVLLASVGTAWVSSLVGISMALGAFLAGLMLAESEFSHQAHAEIRPVRDVLAGLFFISLGMLVDPSALAGQLPMVIGATAAIVLLKATVAAVALLAVSAPLRVAATAGLGLAQVGEFSFVVGRAGLDVGLLTPRIWQTLLASSILTMALTPLLLTVAPTIAARLARRSSRQEAALATDIPTLQDHVVIVGYGMGGQLLARALRDLHVPYLIMELNGRTVRAERAAGESIFYGDAANPDALEAAGVSRALAVVGVLSDPMATTRMISTVRALSPSVPVIVRTRFVLEAERMAAQGASFAVAEELEASLEVLAQMLARLDVPGNVIEVLLDGFRDTSRSARRVRAPSSALDALPSGIMKTPVATHQILDGHWVIGRTIAEADLRATTGALILAVRQQHRQIASPPADLQLAAGDVLYLVGDDSDILLARERLDRGTG